MLPLFVIAGYMLFIYHLYMTPNLILAPVKRDGILIHLCGNGAQQGSSVTFIYLITTLVQRAFVFLHRRVYCCRERRSFSLLHFCFINLGLQTIIVQQCHHIWMVILRIHIALLTEIESIKAICPKKRIQFPTMELTNVIYKQTKLMMHIRYIYTWINVNIPSIVTYKADAIVVADCNSIIKKFEEIWFKGVMTSRDFCHEVKNTLRHCRIPLK